jgi:SAM-dependent methyltransferase
MNFSYPGSELELFAEATNWKRYVAGLVAPYIGETVLDVGAGIGGHIPFLCKSGVHDWVCLEPDELLASHIARGIADGRLPTSCRVITGNIDQLGDLGVFSTVLYLDVLEHILEDRAELDKAAARLAPGGSLIVLAPAHEFLFSAFDREIGHYRRYSAAALRALAPSGCRLVSCRLLDAAGFFASLGNRLVLRSASPSARQIGFWDKALVPVSRRLDRCLGYRFGKSVLALWNKSPLASVGGGGP